MMGIYSSFVHNLPTRHINDPAPEVPEKDDDGQVKLVSPYTTGDGKAAFTADLLKAAWPVEIKVNGKVYKLAGVYGNVRDGRYVAVK
jgi:hypothetical protein